MGAAAWLPKLLAVITRSRQLNVTSEISRFETILKAQDGQLEDCREECAACHAELKVERNERVREREHFFEQIARTNRRVNECEGILHRMGWQDQRSVRRPSIGDRDAG